MPIAAYNDTVTCDNCSRKAASYTMRRVPGGDHWCDKCFYNTYQTCNYCTAVILRSGVANEVCLKCADSYLNVPRKSFRNRQGFSELRSERAYGIELETSKTYGLTKLNLSGWGAKDDCTVTGKELCSTILRGDGGLKAIRRLADFAEKHKWKIDNDCGFHLHLDMRGSSRKTKYAVAYAYRLTERVWYSFVEDDRREGEYCHECTWSAPGCISAYTEGTDFNDWNHHDRYNWINTEALYDHNTFEIRLHHATIDADTVCNWVKAHTRFADWAAKLGLAEIKAKLANKSIERRFEVIADEAWKDTPLSEYYLRRAQSLNQEIGSVGLTSTAS